MLDLEVEASVRRRAVEFRTAFDSARPTHPCLPQCPRGWCTMASMLLGEYLRGVGLGDFRSRSGMRQVGEFSATHAWLEQDGPVVDITADQFADVDQAVLVGFESAWHRLWSPIGGGSVALLAFYEGDDHRELVHEIYEWLRSSAEASFRIGN